MASNCEKRKGLLPQKWKKRDVMHIQITIIKWTPIARLFLFGEKAYKKNIQYNLGPDFSNNYKIEKETEFLFV